MIASNEVLPGENERAIRTVGKCIYCHSTIYRDRDPTQPLGNEHVIPRNIGGNLLVKQASCHECERETSRLESHCADRIWGAAKPHLGFRGRKSGKVARNIKIGVTSGGTEATPCFLKIEDHPGHLFNFTFGLMPRLLLGLPKDVGFAGQLSITSLVPNARERVVRAERRFGNKIQIGSNMNAAMFGRLLAKIAHSYAVGVLGIDGFNAYLGGVILGNADSGDLTYYVGGSDGEAAKQPALHQLFLDTEKDMDGRDWLTVRIRLFSNHEGTPTSRVVVDQRQILFVRAHHLPLLSADLIGGIKFTGSARDQTKRAILFVC